MPVHHASVRRSDLAIVVNQQRHRHSIEPIFVSETYIVDHDWEVHLVLFNKCLHWFPLLVHRNANDVEPLVLVPFLKLNKPRHFQHTTVEPRWPEIEHDHSAFAVGLSDAYTLGAVHSKL